MQIQRVDLSTCPSLFSPTSSQNGQLIRVRLLGGFLNSTQADALADFAERFANGVLLITNRANLQMRVQGAEIPPSAFQEFQFLGLAGAINELDRLRNIMASPTAGIDPKALIDSRQLVKALDEYISHNMQFVGLSAKFSIGIDGREEVSIRNRTNDIWFVAEQVEQLVQFRLSFGMGRGQELKTNVLLYPQECIPVVAAIAQVYLNYFEQIEVTDQPHRRSKKPRLRDLISARGIEWYLEKMQLECSAFQAVSMQQHAPLAPVGIHPQMQSGYFYMGIILELGQLNSRQLRGLSVISTRYGSGALRITPWQNILIPDVKESDLEALQKELSALDIDFTTTHPGRAIVACAGRSGCEAAKTSSQEDASALIQRLQERFTLDEPINIHVSSCEKGCAQPFPSDLALLGCSDAAYEIYLRDGQQLFGRLLTDAAPAADVLDKVEKIVEVYLQQRQNSQESFRQWVEQQSISYLQTLLVSSHV
jgi:ferredoxin-nitrite reductase